MSDSIIRVKNSSNNFIDRNLLVSSYKRKKKSETELTDLEIRRRREMPLLELKWDKQNKKLANQRKQEKQRLEKNKIEKKKRNQQKEQSTKRATSKKDE